MCSCLIDAIHVLYCVVGHFFGGNLNKDVEDVVTIAVSVLVFFFISFLIFII